MTHRLASTGHRPAATSRQAGVGMVELLVALVIFAFGMLGLAGLQTQTLWYGQSSLFRSQATALADDILDRMRADRLNARAGRWDTTLTAKSESFGGTELYKVDMQEWKKQVEDLLPSGAASVATVDDVVTVIIQWDDSRGREAAEEFKTVSRL